jgi:hypothetical protein
MLEAFMVDNIIQINNKNPNTLPSWNTKVEQPSLVYGVIVDYGLT